MVQFKRREFIGLVGGAAAWPLAARAQQPAVKRIGIIMPALPEEADIQERITALRRGLQDLGWIEGRNYRFEFRWPGTDAQRIVEHAREFVGLAADVIVVGSLPAVLALKRATTSIPIVFANLADPVGSGVIPSLARPGGNITGFTAYEYSIVGKWLQLLKEIAPSVSRVGLVHGAREQFGLNGTLFYRAAQNVAPATALELVPILVRSGADLDPAIAQFATVPRGGLVAAAEAGAIRNRTLLIAAAAHHRLPAVYPFRFCAVDGGLASYGYDINDQYRRAASYVDRILKGTNPADLPVQAPDKFELVINLKTGRALGLEIPPTLLVRADEVIE